MSSTGIGPYFVLALGSAPASSNGFNTKFTAEQLSVLLPLHKAQLVPPCAEGAVHIRPVRLALRQQPATGSPRLNYRSTPHGGNKHGAGGVSVFIPCIAVSALREAAGNIRRRRSNEERLLTQGLLLPPFRGDSLASGPTPHPP